MTFVQSGSNSDDASGTVLTVTLGANVGAGNLVVVWCKWEGANAAGLTVSGAGGGTWTNGTLIDHANGDLHGQFAFNLAATGGAATVTMTLGAARTFRRLHVWEFSYTGTASLDVQNTGSGNGTQATSGNITTTGTDEVALGGYGEYIASLASGPTINGVAATGSIINSPADSNTASWYRLLTATFTNGNASIAINDTADWVCNIIALKVETVTGQPYSKRGQQVSGFSSGERPGLN